jgi:hypothetical protein
MALPALRETTVLCFASSCVQERIDDLAASRATRLLTDRRAPPQPVACYGWPRWLFTKVNPPPAGPAQRRLLLGGRSIAPAGPAGCLPVILPCLPAGLVIIADYARYLRLSAQRLRAIVSADGSDPDDIAGDEDLIRIRHGAAVWNDWRGQNPERIVDLRGADLGEAIRSAQ